MSRLRFNWKEAVAFLCARSPELAAFIRQFGRARMRISDAPDVFSALAQSIAYQQLSGRAAGAIHRRFEALFPGDRPSAQATLGFSTEALRDTGLSRAKVLSIQDLAEKCLSGEVPSRQRLGRLSDEQVIQALTRVRGIGPWTGQMYLMFHMGRPDVMPATDLGIQKGVLAVYGLDRLPTPGDVLEQTRELTPYRTAASWYFWRASNPANWKV